MPTPLNLELDSINPKKKKSTKFGPDRKSTVKGRALGSKNIYSRDVRAAILDAGNAVGDGTGRGGLRAYLETVARVDRRAFCALLGKAMPLQINSDGASAVPIVAIHISSVASGHNADGSVMAVVNPPTIKHEPQRAPAQDARSRRLAELKAMPLERLAELAGVDIADVVED
ncbi:hypothetical protein QIH96_05335 [Bradyrhizobium japonicum]|uniref:hypothetical protein n=1 Tax=Bradyrhizobium japonicum TaxID=375 RepID=UPI0027152EA0|nr:hypothetical protein [Bradyrhizobium japonicum]WLB64668.1 hypothetical protein QIH96_05335 [Bradyrhizobium japonicum]